MERPPMVRLFDDQRIALAAALADDEFCLDGFAGGGGTSTGIEMVLGRSPDVAINHDAEALAMHEANHPQTRHIRSNIRKVSYRRVARGRRCGFAWFSPDCTFFSKARGAKPFRDRNRARRIRGLAWEAVRCAVEIRPRVIFIENVEEFLQWAPIGANGLPEPSKLGRSFRLWLARLKNLGYAVEWRELRACDFGAPTSRKRLFIIARCDGQPIVWPRPTHGPRQAQPYRTAAECIDWSLPVPSIFLNKREAKAWGKAHGVPAPKRPLAIATQRRIARGIQRFVLDAAEPFIIRFAHGERDAKGKKRGKGEHSLRLPLPTVVTTNEFAIVAPTLIQTHERRDVRTQAIDGPLRTITANGARCFGLVAAFLAKHNGGHEATGQPVLEAMHAITTRDQKALVTSHLLKFKGTCRDGQEVTAPMPTVQAHGNHIAEVRAFLVKFYGTKKDGRPMQLPLDTLTTKARFGLATVMVAGEAYVIADIGMRMLTPRELYRAQGFPESYQIDCTVKTRKAGKRVTKRLTKQAQTRLVGNSVSPYHAAAVIGANLTAPGQAAVA